MVKDEQAFTDADAVVISPMAAAAIRRCKVII
jgi:hypothetical protein